MARYIDADKLIETIFPIGLIEDGKYTINAKAIKMAVDSMPTADVAPKSEVAREIFEEMQSCLMIRHWHGNDILTFEFDAVKYAELKKKYTVSNSEQRTDTKQTPLSPNKRDIDTKALLSDLKKAVHDKAVYSYSKDMYPYINLKVFDAILQDYINKLEKR